MSRPSFYEMQISQCGSYLRQKLLPILTFPGRPLLPTLPPVELWDILMVNLKNRWTSDEEEALRAGVAKHGAGKWLDIQRDPEFNHRLFSRSNDNLRDKWWKLRIKDGQGPRAKSKTPNTKANPAEAPATPLAIAQTPATVPSSQDASADVVMLDSSMPLSERSRASK